MSEQESKGIAEYVVSVDVQDAPGGDGNAVGGKYRYVFDPDIAIVQSTPVRLIYRMTPTTRKGLTFGTLYSNDGRYQFGKPEAAPDGRSISVIDVNTQRMLINIMLQLADAQTQSLVHVDPQVLNEPEVPG